MGEYEAKNLLQEIYEYCQSQGGDVADYIVKLIDGNAQ